MAPANIPFFCIFRCIYAQGDCISQFSILQKPGKKGEDRERVRIIQTSLLCIISYEHTQNQTQRWIIFLISIEQVFNLSNEHVQNLSAILNYFTFIITIQNNKLIKMSIAVYHEDLCELFQRADCESILSRKAKDKNQITLQNFKADPMNGPQSIKALRAVIDALIYLRENLIMPCQLKFQYIICSNKWGLCHAICQRGEEIQKQNNDSYNPEEYLYHSDSENELVWNIGKVWLRFFTSEPIKIRSMHQKKINQIVDNAVKVQQINILIKKLLTREKDQRIKFEQLIMSDIFFDQGEQKHAQITKYYTSLMNHLKNISGIIKSRGGMSKLEKKNPYIRQINYRRFMEYLDIDLFLENVKSDIRKEYYNEQQVQKVNCEFTFHIITLQDYKNMVQLSNERVDLGERFEDIYDRLYYARFTKRMIMLKDILQRKSKVLKNNQFLKSKFTKFLEDPDVISEDSVYLQFKTCLSEYAEYLNDDLKGNPNDITALKLMTKIFIARTSGYVFNQYRTEVFKPFLGFQKGFNLKKVLAKVNQCNEIQPLKLLLCNIKEFYFKN